jgi:hypothetical protein
VKKLLAASFLALGLLLASQQQASAWSKFNASIGASVNWEGGNYNFLWGAIQSGQIPGYPTDVYRSHSSSYGNQGGYGPVIMGGYPNGYVAPMPTEHGGMPNGQQMPSGQPAQAKPGATPAIYYSNYNYQPVGYSYPTNGNYYQYPASNYYQYPTYGYPQQVPSYWYGY